MESAQTLAEWTQQNKTQIKYLVEQIAALQAYALVAEKGYSIAKTGLNAIGNIKNYACLSSAVIASLNGVAERYSYRVCQLKLKNH